jgi:hypothetical protein
MLNLGLLLRTQIALAATNPSLVNHTVATGRELVPVTVAAVLYPVPCSTRDECAGWNGIYDSSVTYPLYHRLPQ